MLPSMRYHSAKLSELVHEKNYRLHLRSVDKIKSKTSDEMQRRSQQLQELQHRKLQSYQHTQQERSKQIGHINALLFSKIMHFQPSSQEETHPLEELQQQIEHAMPSPPSPMARKSSEERHFVLRNHRQSPIHKSTLLERSRENIRLAKKIVSPVVTYETARFEKEHQYLKYMKGRIMRYEPEVAKPKAEIYVSKRLSLSQLDRKGSNRSLSSYNPESTPTPAPNTRISAYLSRK